MKRLGRGRCQPLPPGLAAAAHDHFGDTGGVQGASALSDACAVLTSCPTVGEWTARTRRRSSSVVVVVSPSLANINETASPRRSG